MVDGVGQNWETSTDLETEGGFEAWTIGALAGGLHRLGREPRGLQHRRSPLPGLRGLLANRSFFWSSSPAPKARGLSSAAGSILPLGWAVWGRGNATRFDGRDGNLSLNGDVLTATLGTDYERGRILGGVALARSYGQGDFAALGIGAQGEIESTLTSIHPYVRVSLSERLDVWGTMGYGRGGLKLRDEWVGQSTEVYTDIDLRMGALGLRGDLLNSGVESFRLAFKTDALWVGTDSEGVDAPNVPLTTSAGTVTRVRTALEASRGYVFGQGFSLRPGLEVGLRRDGGDAETGAGVDIAGSLMASDPSTGLSVDVRVRTLLVHQSEEFQEQGVSVSLSYAPTPSTPLGFLARVTPSWGGQATSGARALWGRETMAGMPHGGIASGSRLEAELGYGLPVGSRLVGTPRIGIRTSAYGRDYRLGYGLTVLQAGIMSFNLGVDAHRRESPVHGGTGHGVQGRLTASW